MKIRRKKLRKIINEFLDTSRPMTDQSIPDLKDLTSTSAYDQLTNSERAAFISAMGISGDAGIPGTSQELNEGDVIKFPTIDMANVDMPKPWGSRTYVSPHDDTESDFTDPSQEEIDIMSSMMSNIPEDDVSRWDDEDFEAYLQALESGKLVDLFDDE